MLSAQTRVDVSSNISDNTLWTADNYYVLNGFIFVEEGATLTIEPGTMVYAEEGSEANASALIVKRGAKINAVGTSDEPIVFTSILAKDNVLTKDDRGLWGGLIILGKGPHNNSGNDNDIEGVPAEENAFYGGDDPIDNSGRLRFVSIRHGGSELKPDEEINGLTLGAVGSGTSISFVEVFGNDDDGVEWFGGNVNSKNMVVAFCSDESYDMDEGYHGMGQFWLAVVDGDADQFGEHDGGPSSNRYGMPFATPVQSNVTYIGARTEDSEDALSLREFWGGQYHNSIFAEQAKGIRVDYVENYTDGALGGSYTLWNQGVLQLTNNIFQNVADGTPETLFRVYSNEQVDDGQGGETDKYPVPADSASAFAAYFTAANNSVASVGVSTADPVPSGDVSGPDFSQLGSFFKKVDYKGAFNPAVTGGHWAGSWTLSYAADNFEISAPGEVIVTDDITSDVTWTSDNDYILDGFIFVEEGATLTIEPGTVVYAEEGSEANASALIVKRGGKIMAEGTANDPIIFTSILERDGELTELDRGLWGGLILLGKGPHNNSGNDNDIEGVPAEENAFYGGDDVNDNSGSLMFVSIRHGGSELRPDEEINGLTLGAVGAGTSISFIEVYANDDDGVEWFGGNVNSTNMLVAYCSDESFDMDEGYHGMGQFWLAITDGEADQFGEHDGGPSSNRYGMPFATPVQSNVTYIGSRSEDSEDVLSLRVFWGGQYHNSIFAEQAKGIRVDYVENYTDGALGGSYTLWNQGVLQLTNNIFQNVADGTPEALFRVYSNEQIDDGQGGETDKYPVPADSASAFAAYFTTANNTVNNSLGVSHGNPVPAAADVVDPSFDGLDAFFARVDYKGAFNPDIDGVWTGQWTKTYADAIFNDETGVGTEDVFTAAASINVFPNPLSYEIATVQFDNPNADVHSFAIYSLDGKLVKSIQDIREESFTFNRDDMEDGLYIYQLKRGSMVVGNGKLIVR